MIMKKLTTYLLAALALTAMVVSLGSCDRETTTPDPEVGTLVFEIMTAGVTPATRAGTPFYSVSLPSPVSTVTVYVFERNESGDFMWTRSIPLTEWSSAGTSYVYTVPEANMLPAGTYKFLAVGSGVITGYTLPTLDESLNYNNMTVTGTSTDTFDEIYAGSSDNVTITSEGARVGITMKRKVAGVMGYFVNVPVNQEGVKPTALRLTATTRNTGVNLTSDLGITPSAAVYNILDIDLTGLADNGTVFTGATIPGIVKLDNSQLQGHFVFPVEDVILELGLYNGTTELRTWEINNGDPMTLAANHLYTLGTKQLPGSTAGDPDSDDQKPDSGIDLMTDQQIMITVDTSWDDVTDLIIE